MNAKDNEIKLYILMRISQIFDINILYVNSISVYDVFEKLNIQVIDNNVVLNSRTFKININNTNLNAQNIELLRALYAYLVVI